MIIHVGFEYKAVERLNDEKKSKGEDFNRTITPADVLYPESKDMATDNSHKSG